MLEANTQIKCMNDKLNQLAVTDKLTGLYNREGFYGNLSRYSKKKMPFTIMYIDLDNFKYYNDTFGHGVGDIILIEMANIFSDEVGEDGFVTRYGGDEFLITLYYDDRQQVEQLARNIYSRIAEADGFTDVVTEKIGKTINISDQHRISCSIGISSVESLADDEQIEKVVKEADKVLYDVKKSGKGVYRFYAS
jgi:diguanylate cyclase (GGDEF)-like protein